MFRLDEFAILPDGTLSSQDGLRFVSLGFDLLAPSVPSPAGLRFGTATLIHVGFGQATLIPAGFGAATLED